MLKPQFYKMTNSLRDFFKLKQKMIKIRRLRKWVILVNKQFLNLMILWYLKMIVLKIRLILVLKNLNRKFQLTKIICQPKTIKNKKIQYK